MECNKDEAIKAKEIAEQMLTKKDIAGAQKFAMKAQSLFPGLDGLSQFLEVLDIYIASGKKINGEVDFYGVLSVGPSVDIDTIRKQYRRLALALHPDKNKSVGADGAFKILSEAWSLLSDGAKRMTYDQKRAMRNVGIGSPSMQGSQNGFHFSTTGPANARNSTSATFQQSPVAPRPSKSATFWTSCNRCIVKYEYLKIYLNRVLVCPNCQQPFWATEVSAPPVKGRAPSSTGPFPQQQKGTNCHAANGSPASGVKLPTAFNTGIPGYSSFGSKISANNKQAQFFNSRGGNGVPPCAAPAMETASHGQPAGENLKRVHEEAAVNTQNQDAFQQKSNSFKKTDIGSSPNLGSSSAQADRLPKKRRINEQKSNSKRNGLVNQLAGKAGSGSQGNMHEHEKGVLRAEGVAVAGNNKPRSSRELSQLEVRNMLVGKARMEICKKLKEWSTNKEDNKKEKKQSAAAPAGQGYLKNDPRKEETVSGKLVDLNKSDQQKNCAVDSEPEDSEIEPMIVPDSDFHDFDEDRTEKIFEANQVWAAYDNDDGMARYYALIHNVISRKPFKVRISWLNSKSNSELGPINWVGSGFMKTSGYFRIGKHEIYKMLNSFSHMVKWTKGARGVIQIFPTKGDVWALYRNWSPKWNEQTPDEVIHKYDMVEVLGDYSEKEGVLIAPLIKVAGFKSVFHQYPDAKHIRTIPREEMFRFSHQVPSYLLTGEEARNLPKGCRELDPAAIPLEHLQIMTQAEIEEQRKTAESSKLEKPDGESQVKARYGIGNVIKGEDGTIDSKNVVRKPLLTYSRKNKGKVVGRDTGEAKGETSLAGAQSSGL